MGGGWWQEAESPADSGRASGMAGQQGWTARRATLGKTEEAEQGEVRKAPHSPAGRIEAITGPLTWFDHIKGQGACPQRSEEAWGEERCTGFSTFSKFPQHRQLEKPIFKNHLLSIMESDSPFYYHLFSQTQ